MWIRVHAGITESEIVDKVSKGTETPHAEIPTPFSNLKNTVQKEIMVI